MMRNLVERYLYSMFTHILVDGILKNNYLIENISHA